MTNFLTDIITYIRRIVKTPSDTIITDALLIDYINRFWLMDVDARIQLFDMKTTYQFQTTPGVDQYNMPLYDVQTEAQGETIGMFPVYQGFFGPAEINGIDMPFYTQRNDFYNLWPSYNQTLLQAGIGNGTNGPYQLQLPFLPNASQILPNSPLNINNSFSSGIIRGHVDIAGIIATGNNIDPPLDTVGNGSDIPEIPVTSILPQVYFTATGANAANTTVQDSGVFLDIDDTYNQNYGLLYNQGKAPYGNETLAGGYYNSFPITAITNANPASITVNNNFSIGQIVTINSVAGMTELNGNTYTVTSASSNGITIDVDSTGFGVYVSGGFVVSISNVINYQTGLATNIFFDQPIPLGAPIQGQCVFYQTGIPRAVLFYNNVLTLRAPPNTQYLVQLDAYYTPAAFFSSMTTAIPFGYMAEYIARGAARKILSDVGDVEQFNFYEPLFKEQELLVWKRSQRIWTATRTQTIYCQDGFQNTYNNSSGGV